MCTRNIDEGTAGKVFSRQAKGVISMRAVIYARYSTDLQRDASIEDQVRLCRERIEREGWSLLATYSDAAASGGKPAAAGLPEAAGGRPAW